MQFFLYVYYNNDTFAKFLVKKYVDFPELYFDHIYFERPTDELGKGTLIHRSIIRNITISSFPMLDWEDE